MKANELMLGDWVAFRKDFPDRVNAIAIGGHAVSLKHDSWQQMSSIRPIPLTPEIFEKNGFVPRGSGWYIPNTPRLDLGILSFGIDDGCGTGFSQMSNGDFVFFSKYVHEIQHCLRMIHVEKEIVL